MVGELIACPGRDRLMDVLNAEKLMEVSEFFQIGERLFSLGKRGGDYFEFHC